MTAPSERFALHRGAAEERVRTFGEDVRAGLTAAPKTLPPKYFYDPLGSHLFEAICLLPEYYPTRAEREILSTSAAEIVEAVGGPLRLVELGSGSSEKTRLVIEAALARQERLRYVPVEISRSAVERASEDLLRSYPALSITAFVADYSRGVAFLETAGRQPGERTLVLFLGSTVGNLDPVEALELLARVRAALAPGDALLLGADLKKSAAVLLPAYDDPLGVTAAFNLNLLARINRELGGRFDLRRFAHRACWDAGRGRMEMHLVSRRAQRVAIDGLELEVAFERGESIHTESSYKYDLGQLAALARSTSFALETTWQDSARRFSVGLLRAA